MVFLYDLALKIYATAILLASPFKAKARQWIEGRKQEILYNDQKKPLIWMHCASLGEFEQGRPLLEEIKNKFPEKRILLSFFSPSGYELQKNYKLADVVVYLPLDTKKNAKQFLEKYPISLAIFVKYDLWFHYMNALQQQQIPSILISAIFRPNQFYFKSVGAFLEEKIKRLDHIFVQNQSTHQFLEKRAYKNLVLAGDTRLDRVLAIRNQNKEFPLIEAFVGTTPVLVFGSTWPQDEALIQAFLKENQQYKIIVAPHQIEENSIQKLAQSLAATRYSKADRLHLDKASVLIVDNVGMLASLYRYAKIAYVGGGFKTGLHNTMEAAVYGIPVVFGPKYEKFEEAQALVASGGGFSISSYPEFSSLIKDLEDQEKYAQSAAAASRYIQENQGATDKIMNKIRPLLDIIPKGFTK